MEWIHRCEEVKELPEDIFGFIYLLTYIKDSKLYYYIGKKQTHSYTTKPVLKSGKKRPNAISRFGKNVRGKRKYYETVKKENDWRDYEGSADIPEEYVLLSKTILKYCYSKRSLTYYEVKYQFMFNVLEREECLNNNILGSFFRDCIE
jgi:hypothetical protein